MGGVTGRGWCKGRGPEASGRDTTKDTLMDRRMNDKEEEKHRRANKNELQYDYRGWKDGVVGRREMLGLKGAAQW